VRANDEWVSPSDVVPPELMTTAPQEGRARRSLRNETAELHEAVERHFAPGRMTRDWYIRYLLMNQPFTSIEPALEAASIHRVLPDWDMRRRRFALASDMVAMGLPTCETRTIAIADDVGTLLGWSYVLEGSRHGARVILKQIESIQSPELTDATRFLRHGTETNLWTRFTAALSRLDNDQSAIENACGAARRAFHCFKEVAESFQPVADSR
jgi:heme oxygenase